MYSIGPVMIFQDDAAVFRPGFMVQDVDAINGINSKPKEN